MAAEIYQKLAYPFVKLLLSVVLGVLFIIVLIMGLRMIFGNTDDENRKAWNMFIYGIVGILIVSMSRTIVEFVYGSYEEVVPEG